MLGWQFLSKLFRRKNPQIQYEIWVADYFDYKDIEWSCYAVCTDKEQAEKELKQLREKAGESSIIKCRLQERRWINDGMEHFYYKTK